MRTSMWIGGPLLAALGLGLGAGCSGGAGAEEGAGEATDTLEDALLGLSTVTQSCLDQGRSADLAKIARYGRILSRSGAYLECVRRGFEDSITFTQVNDNTYGPYIACGTGTTATDNGHRCDQECPTPPAGSDCRCDPLRTSGRTAQLARLLTATATRDSVVQDCADPLGGGHQAQAGTGPETWLWTSLSTSPNWAYAPGVAWHEAMHTRGYSHGNGVGQPGSQSPDNCGFGLNRTDLYTERNAATNIVGACMIEVAYRSEASAAGNCDLESNLCAANELRVVRTFDSTSGDCVCVPDAFAGENEGGDRFGESQATGDFDDDGIDDLVVGAPGEGGDIGVIYVFRGTAQGLVFWKRVAQTGLRVFDFRASSTPFTPAHAQGDEFGFAVASGDMNGDGYDEIFAAAPGKDGDAGVVYALPGSSSGPDLSNGQWIDQAEAGHTNEPDDRHGAALAVGHFNGDAFADLAVGAPFESPGPGEASGAVTVYSGKQAAIGATMLASAATLDQEFDSSSFSNDEGDEFGAALAAGNIDSDSQHELVVGAPGELESGAIFVFHRGQSWTQPSRFFQSSTRFGETLAIGDIAGDGTGDVAVGAPAHDSETGAVFVYRGQSGGNPTFSQRLDSNETADRYGAALAIGNVGVNKADLLVGVPGETFGSGPAEGRVLVYSGTTNSTLSSSPVYALDQAALYDAGTSDTVLPPEARGVDGFGRSIALWMAPGASAFRPVVGAPLDQITTGISSGALFVYTGQSAERKIDQMTQRFSR